MPESVVIGGSYSPSFLRSPYAESAESLDASIHAVARNRSGNQSTLLGAPEKRSQHDFRAAEATETAGASYLGLTRLSS